MYIIHFFLLLLLWVGFTNCFEFDHDSCQSLLPSQKLHAVDDNGRFDDDDDDGGKHFFNLVADDDDDDDDIEQADNAYDVSSFNKETNLKYQFKPAPGPAPFFINVSSAIYRRKRPLTVTIRGAEFNGFIIMANSAASKQSRVAKGAFFSLPPVAKYLRCYLPHDTAINKDTGGKRNLALNWKAPDEDCGLIVFRATIVQKNIYWANVESMTVRFKQFPPNFSDCGKRKSCYRYSTKNPNCEPEECDYIAITRITEDNEIEFTIGGIIEEHLGYIGIGFTLDKEKMTHMDIGACVKEGNLVETRRYIIHSWNEKPHLTNKIFIEEEVDRDGKMIWCQYRRPLRAPGHASIDFTHTLHHAFV